MPVLAFEESSRRARTLNNALRLMVLDVGASSLSTRRKGSQSDGMRPKVKAQAIQEETSRPKRPKQSFPRSVTKTSD